MADNSAANASGGASPVSGKIEISSLLPNDRVIDEASRIPVLDSDGKEHLFGKICRWPEEEGKTRRVMVVYIRHFFCGSCQEYIKALVASIGDPSSLPPATKLVIIGCGAPSLIPMYINETKCTFPLYTDPTGQLYDTLGMAQTLSLQPAASYISQQSVFGAAMKGIYQGLKRVGAGDALKGGKTSQVGGEFLFETTEDDQGRTTTKVTWCHRMKSTRDHIEIAELRQVLGLSATD